MIAYILTDNVPELVPFLLFIVLKIPMAIETIMMLIITMGNLLINYKILIRP